MTRTNECGHADQGHHAKGMCRKCYTVADAARKKQYDIEYYKLSGYKKLQLAKIWYLSHKSEKLRYDVDYRRRRSKEDVNYRIARALRKRTNMAIRNNAKSGSAVRDLGCSISQFRLYIENQFESGMSWDNYGEWHLDHVMPLASFNLEDRSEFLTACNWLNYQPMWAKDNISKGAKIG